MLNEKNTENYVRNKLHTLGYYKNENIIIEEERSKNPRIDKLLKYASKRGPGSRKPEFLISFKHDTDFLIVIECKADTSKHESHNRDQYKDYAVDGVLLYSQYLSNEYNVLSIAVSGESENEINISHFMQLKRSYVSKNIQDKLFLDYKSYKGIFEKQSKPLKDDELIKKAIKYNKDLHSYSVPEIERCTVISAILVALQDEVFRDVFHKHVKNLDLVKDMISACSRVLDKNDLSDVRKCVILYEYRGIEHKGTLTDDNVKKKKSKILESNTILKDLITDLRDSVLPFIKENDFDILGRFYREFIRYTGSDKKTGLVLTPLHITEFFCEISNLQYDDIVFDPCCGTGGFLVSAMKWMSNKCGNDQKEWKKIKTERILGIEKRADMFTHACSNMMMRGDGKSNIYNNDCFDEETKKKIRDKYPNKAFLNPPYDVGEDGQLEFVENALDCLRKSGICIAICQISTVTSNKKSVLKVRERLLKKHTLKAVFSMPDDLFHPASAVVTGILVFEACIPHPEGTDTFFGYFKNDGYVKRRNKGRVPIKEGNTLLWDKKKKEMINLYTNNKSKSGLSVTKFVTAKDEWCAEAYMETDYRNLTKDDFIKTLKNYAAFQFLRGNTK